MLIWGSDCGPYVDPPRLVTGLRGSPLVRLSTVGPKKSAVGRVETLRALYRGKAQHLQRERAVRPTQPPRCVSDA